MSVRVVGDAPVARPSAALDDRRHVCDGFKRGVVWHSEGDDVVERPAGGPEGRAYTQPLKGLGGHAI